MSQMRLRSPHFFASVGSALRTLWQRMTPRERLWVRWAAALGAIALLYSVAVAPAWRLYRHRDMRHAQLDAELSQMMQLAAQARQLRARPPFRRAEAQAALEAMVRAQKKSLLQVQEASWSIELVEVDAATLAQWIVRSRVQLGLRVQRLSARRLDNLGTGGVNAGAAGSNPESAGAARLPLYSGWMVLGVP